MVPCSLYANARPAVKVERSGYVGGFYGNSNELNMMKEIRARGPISGDLEVPVVFSLYTGGIFSEEGTLALKRLSEEEKIKLSDDDDINEMTLSDYEVSWQLINHSILIIGWGVEKGQKFWLCQNSYGPNWGEKGYFKIRRGMNDYGIESEPSFYVPRLESHLQ